MSNLPQDVEAKIETIKYLQSFINTTLFEDNSDIANNVSEKLKGFARQELGTILNMNVGSTPTLTVNEILALKALAKSILSPEGTQEEPVKTPTRQDPKDVVGSVGRVEEEPKVRRKRREDNAVRQEVVTPKAPIKVNKVVAPVSKLPEPKAKKYGKLMVQDAEGRIREKQVELSTKEQVKPEPSKMLKTPVTQSEQNAVNAMVQAELPIIHRMAVQGVAAAVGGNGGNEAASRVANTIMATPMFDPNAE
jgi:hypothetical protein